MLQSLLTEIGRPLPLLPSHPLTSHGQRLSPWLVNIARALKVMITKAFAFLYQKRTVWMFSLPDFAVNLCFSRCSPFVFNTLDVFQEEVPSSAMSEVVVAKHFNTARVLFVCRSKNTPTQLGRNAGKCWLQSECDAWISCIKGLFVRRTVVGVWMIIGGQSDLKRASGRLDHQLKASGNRHQANLNLR